MSIGIAAILDAVGSHARATGFFPEVILHEPKAAPQSGTCAVFVSKVVPYRERSGLTSVSVVVLFTVRLYANFLQEPQDNIDRDLVIAGDALLTAYAGDIDLGDTSREVDLLGMASGGNGVAGDMGYINHDSKLFRVLDISLPVIVNDVWTEAR